MSRLYQRTLYTPEIKLYSDGPGVNPILSTGSGTLNMSGTNMIIGSSTMDSLDVTNDAVIHGSLTVEGTLASIETTNTEIQDKLITLNKGGLALSAHGSGIEFEENGVISGYIKTASDRNSYEILAPSGISGAKVDNILEYTPNAGILIDGMLIKDQNIVMDGNGTIKNTNNSGSIIIQGGLTEGSNIELYGATSTQPNNMFIDSAKLELRNHLGVSPSQLNVIGAVCISNTLSVDTISGKSVTKSLTLCTNTVSDHNISTVDNASLVMNNPLNIGTYSLSTATGNITTVNTNTIQGLTTTSQLTLSTMTIKDHDISTTDTNQLNMGNALTIGTYGFTASTVNTNTIRGVTTTAQLSISTSTFKDHEISTVDNTSLTMNNPVNIGTYGFTGNSITTDTITGKTLSTSVNIGDLLISTKAIRTNDYSLMSLNCPVYIHPSYSLTCASIKSSGTDLLLQENDGRCGIRINGSETPPYYGGFCCINANYASRTPLTVMRKPLDPLDINEINIEHASNPIYQTGMSLDLMDGDDGRLCFTGGQSASILTKASNLMGVLSRNGLYLGNTLPVTAVPNRLVVDGNAQINTNLLTDTIVEKTTNAGVTIDGTLIKDQFIVFNGNATVKNTANDGSIIIQGGLTEGANIELYGSTSGQPNNMFIDSVKLELRNHLGVSPSQLNVIGAVCISNTLSVDTISGKSVTKSLTLCTNTISDHNISTTDNASLSMNNPLTIGTYGFTSSSVTTDTINEKTVDSGCTIDGVLHKDNTIIFPGNSEIKLSTNTNRLLLQSGNDANNSANIELYAGNHASQANKCFIDSAECHIRLHDGGSPCQLYVVGNSDTSGNIVSDNFLGRTSGNSAITALTSDAHINSTYNRNGSVFGSFLIKNNATKALELDYDRAFMVCPALLGSTGAAATKLSNMPDYSFMYWFNSGDNLLYVSKRLPGPTYDHLAII